MVKLSTKGWLLIFFYFTSTAVLEAKGYSCCKTLELKWSSAPHCNFSDLEPEPLGQYVEYSNCSGRPSYKRAWVLGPTHMTDTYLYFYSRRWYISYEPCQELFHIMSKDVDQHCPQEVTTWIGAWDHMGLVEGCFYTETPEGCHPVPEPPPRPSPESSNWYLYLWIPMGIISILAFIAFMYFKQKKRKRQGGEEGEEEEEDEREEPRDEGYEREQPAPPSYWQAVHM